MEKSPDAFRTISEVADLLETPPHVLRFWETRFPQVRPVKRAGGRRYYRPADIALLAGIRALLHDRGMTIRGVQKILREQGVRHVMDLPEAAVPAGLPEVAALVDSPAATAVPPGAAAVPVRPDPPGVVTVPGADAPPAAPPDQTGAMDPSADAAPADAAQDAAGQGVAVPPGLSGAMDQPDSAAAPAVLPEAPRLSLVPAAPASSPPEAAETQPEDAAMDPRQSDLFARPAAPPGDSAPPPAPEPEPEFLPGSAPAPLPDIAAEDAVPDTGAAPTAAARLRRLGPAALGRHRAALLSVHARLTDLHRRQTAAARGRRG